MVMAGKDGSRAISTINFLLDEKVQGDRLRLDHNWNAHLVTANRQGDQGILKMFKSDWDDDEDNENSSANSSSCNTPRKLHGNSAAHAGCAASPRGGSAPYEAPAQIICTAPAGRAAAVGALTLDLAAVAMQDPNSPIPLVLTPTAPQQLPHNSSRTCYSTATMSAAPACSITAPAPDLQPEHGASTPTGLPNASTAAASVAAPLTPMGPANVIRSARTTAENPATPASAPAEGSEGPEEYRAVNKALSLLWHVQATAKLPACLQPPKPAHLQVQGSPATSPASGSSACSTPNSSILSNSNLMPAGAMAGAGDSLDALVGGRPAGNVSTSNGGCACPSEASLAACRASASFNGHPNSHNHVHWVQQQEAAGRLPNRSMSARNSAAAVAAVGAPGTAEPTGALVRRHTNGTVTVGISTPRQEPLYDPTYEDLKPYLAGAPTEGGLEAFIQRRLQAPAEVEMIPGTKLVKVPATQRYMAAIAVEHKHRLQQREHQALLQVAELQAQNAVGAGVA